MNEHIHIGEEGWLFLKGGSNNAESFYTEKSAFPAERLEQWRVLLDRRSERCLELGIRYIHFLAPDKTSIYPEYYRASLPNIDFHPIKIFESELLSREYWLNVLPHIEKAKIIAPTYYKTDSHWNFQGCYAGYECVCRKLMVEPNYALTERPRSRVEMCMDLGQKLSPPITETVEFFHLLRDAKRTFANDLAQYNESTDVKKYGPSLYNSIVTFVNKRASAEPLKVLVFGDSFCEFRTHMMTGMLAETFREVTFVWNHCVDFNFVREYKPDVLITETVERFVNRVPVDDVDILKAARERFKEIMNKKTADKTPADKR